MPTARSWGAALAAWFARPKLSSYGWNVVGSTDTSNDCGDNGLFGGQLQPCLVFLGTLSAVLMLQQPDDVCYEDWDQALWGSFVRLMGVAFMISFASLRVQLIALAGSSGLYPLAPLLAQTRADMPSTLPRCAHFPVAWLWWWCDDDTLRATCTLGMFSAAAAAYGALGASGPALVLAWICWIILATAIPIVGYPWDNLLSEAGFATAALLPPLAPLHDAQLGFVNGHTPSWAATWTLRIMLVRVMFGMGKFVRRRRSKRSPSHRVLRSRPVFVFGLRQKFSRGWAHPSNSMFLKHFMSWQPLPTPLAALLHAHTPDGVWHVLHVAMWLLEVSHTPDLTSPNQI